MRGHEEIVRMRLEGIAPEAIFINDFPCQTDWWENDDHCTVCTFGEPIKTLDMRFCVGMVVSICSDSEKRSKELFEACKGAGARVIASSHHQVGKLAWQQDGWTTVWQR